MDKKYELIQLEEEFRNKLKKINNEMTIMLYLFLIDLEGKEIKIACNRFCLSNGKTIFIKRVFISNNRIMIEHAYNNYENHYLDFNKLSLSDKNLLYYVLSQNCKF